MVPFCRLFIEACKHKSALNQIGFWMTWGLVNDDRNCMCELWMVKVIRFKDQMWNMKLCNFTCYTMIANIKRLKSCRKFTIRLATLHHLCTKLPLHHCAWWKAAIILLTERYSVFLAWVSIFWKSRNIQINK